MSESPQPSPADVVAHLMTRDAFSQLLGMEVLDVGAGRAVVRMAVREDMVNGFGTLHGGALFSLLAPGTPFAYRIDDRRPVPIRGDHRQWGGEHQNVLRPLGRPK